MKNDKQQCNHDSLEPVTGLDNKNYKICYQCGYSSLPESEVKNLFQTPLSNETKVVESTYSRGENESLEDWKIRLDKICLTPEFKYCQRIIENQSPSCYPDIALLMLEYAYQFKNTDAVKVYAENRKVELKTEFLDNDNPFRPDYYNARINELDRILKLIQR